MRGRLQSGRSAQVLLGRRVRSLGQHQAEVEVRLEYIGLGGNGFAVGLDRLRTASCGVVDEGEVIPGTKILGVGLDGFLQERFGSSEVLLVYRGFGAHY